MSTVPGHFAVNQREVSSQRTTLSKRSSPVDLSEGSEGGQLQKKERKRHNAVLYRARKRQQTEQLQETVRVYDLCRQCHDANNTA